VQGPDAEYVTARPELVYASRVREPEEYETFESAENVMF
jgi:hypothetical protein